MSRFEDMAAADLAAITGDDGDMSTAGTLASCDGTASGPANAFLGDSTDALQSLAGGTADQRSVPAMFNRADVLRILGRDLVHGDEFTVDAGANAGTWTVSAPIPDDAGGVNCTLRLDHVDTAARSPQ